MARHFGLIPSTLDPSVRSASQFLKATAPPPASADSLLQYASVHDQQSTDSCVWFALAQALHVWLKSGKSTDEWISTLFGYWNTLQQQGQLVDEGCQPRVALSVLQQAGFCGDSVWPFVEGNVLQQPPPDAYTYANDNKILVNGYYLLDSTGDQLITDVKTALSSGYPVIYGTTVDQGYENYSGGIMPVPNGTPIGRHQRCLVAYTPDYVQEVNSWGTGWGESGLARINWEIITWAQAGDFWVIDSVPVPTS
jgi:hypothetical protein